MKLKFEAEIIEIKVKKTASNDKEVKIILVSNDDTITKLKQYIAEDTVMVEVSKDEIQKR